MITNADHRLGWKSMTEVQFARVQSQITIFASLICYKCMRVKIEELLGIVMITTYNERFLGFFYEQDEFCLPFRYCETKVWLILFLMITKQGLELMTTF